MFYTLFVKIIGHMTNYCLKPQRRYTIRFLYIHYFVCTCFILDLNNRKYPKVLIGSVITYVRTEEDFDVGMVLVSQFYCAAMDLEIAQRMETTK